MSLPNGMWSPPITDGEYIEFDIAHLNHEDEHIEQPKDDFDGAEIVMDGLSQTHFSWETV